MVSYDLGNQNTCGFGHITEHTMFIACYDDITRHTCCLALHFSLEVWPYNEIFVIQHCLVFNDPETACFY